MEALLAAFMESLKSAATEGAMSEAVAGGGAAPASLGAEFGNYMGNMVNQQIAPTMNAYKGITDPNATMGDMVKSGFQYSFNPKEDEQALNLPQNRISGGMANNYVGGIPSLLQNTNSGILPYIGSR
jgi:hypothetical protein